MNIEIMKEVIKLYEELKEHRQALVKALAYERKKRPSNSPLLAMIQNQIDIIDAHIEQTDGVLQNIEKEKNNDMKRSIKACVDDFGLVYYTKSQKPRGLQLWEAHTKQEAKLMKQVITLASHKVGYGGVMISIPREERRVMNGLEIDYALCEYKKKIELEMLKRTKTNRK